MKDEDIVMYLPPNYASMLADELARLGEMSDEEFNEWLKSIDEDDQ